MMRTRQHGVTSQVHQFWIFVLFFFIMFEQNRGPDCGLELSKEFLVICIESASWSVLCVLGCPSLTSCSVGDRKINVQYSSNDTDGGKSKKLGGRTCTNSRFQASSAKYMTFALFWHMQQRIAVIPQRPFGTTYHSHLQGSKVLDPWRLDR